MCGSDFNLVLYSECWIVVHLQAPVFGLHVVFFFISAAFTAAAAASPAEAHARRHHSVPRLHGVQRFGQKIPTADERGQKTRASFLHDVHHDQKDGEHQHWHPDAHQDLPACDGESQDGQRKQQKAENEIQARKPAVFGRSVAQSFGQSDGHTCEGDGVPQQDTSNVEKEVTQRDLEEKHKLY